jgi:hypothetical protein
MNIRWNKQISGALLAAAMLLLGGCASTELKSTWRAPDDQGAPIAKVAVLVLESDENMRRFAEDQTVRSLPPSTRGVAGYTLFEKPEADVGKLKDKLNQQGFDAILIIRTVSVDKTKTDVPPTTQMVPTGPLLLPTTRLSTDGRTLDTYYSHAWGYTYQTTPGYTAHLTTIVVESVLYRLPQGGAVWSAVTETRNPASKAEMVQDLVELVEKQLAKEGFIARKAK